MTTGQILIAVAVFVVTFSVSLAIAVALLVWMPSDYFCQKRRSTLWTDCHPAVRILLFSLKNLAGLLLIAVGAVLTLPGIPGQGLITILIGVSLMDVPGKRRLECWWVSRPFVLRRINRIRARFNRPPLKLGSEES